MKTIHLLFALIMGISSISLSAQNKQTVTNETVKVWGNCEMCKARIEKAAKAAGATSAKWNVDTKILSVSYNPTQVTMSKIEKSIANTGYDTNNELAGEEAYKKLPECCQYDRKPVEEAKKN